MDKNVIQKMIDALITLFKTGLQNRSSEVKKTRISEIEPVLEPIQVSIYNKTVEVETLVEVEKEKWHVPTHPDHFAVPSQPYLQEDWELYGKFGHHTGVDYGGQRKTGLPLFACADGEIIYREIADSVWGKFLGNHAVIYVPSVDKSFLYCHMGIEPPALGPVMAGEQIGIMGNTGKSAGGAIHLHLEGFHGRFEIVWRSFKSLDDIKVKTFDADAFIRSHLV